MSRDLKTIVTKAVERLNAGDLAGHMELYDPDVVTHGYPPAFSADYRGLESFYAAFGTGFPDARIELEDVIAEDDTVACRVRVTGTHRGDYAGIAPTELPIDLRSMTFLRFADGRCIERWQQLDEMALLRQLEVVPPLDAPGGG